MWLQRLVGLDPSAGGAGGASSDEEGQVRSRAAHTEHVSEQSKLIRCLICLCGADISRRLSGSCLWVCWSCIWCTVVHSLHLDLA